MHHYAGPEVLDALDVDPRRSAPKDRVAVRVRLSIGKKRRTDEAENAFLRIEAQSEEATPLAIADLRDESEVGTEVFSEIVDGEAKVVSPLLMIPIDVKCVPHRRYVRAVRIFRAADQ